MTQVKWSRQLVLAIALCSLGALAYWLEYKHRPEREAADEASKKVFQLKDQQIKSITLEDGPKRFVITCSDISEKLCKPGDNSKWEITEPSKIKADDSNINSLLTTLNSLSSNEIIDLKDETQEKKAALLKEYGLDPESTAKSKKQVRLTTSAGDLTLSFGNVHPIGESMFAIQKIQNQPLGNKVYFIPIYFKVNFEHDLTYWRNKNYSPSEHMRSKALR